MTKISIDNNGLKELLGLKPSGRRGWYSCDCVFCGKENHMGVNLGGDDFIGFNCFKCGEKGSIIRVLKHVNRIDLIDGNYMPDKSAIFSKLIGEKPLYDLTTPTIKMPSGFTRISFHPYLSKRGFTTPQYDIFGVGISNTSVRLKGRVIFTIAEGGDIKGYLGRSTLDSESIRNYNDNRGDQEKHLKYINSVSDFGKLLFGVDEFVVGTTSTAICVEGVTDKASVDRSLNLYSSPKTKCVATFGHKLTREQAIKLHNYGIKNITLFYDPDSISEMIVYGSEYFYLFETVQVAMHPLVFKDGLYLSLDAGDMSSNDIIKTIGSSRDVRSFKLDYFKHYSKLKQ